MTIGPEDRFVAIDLDGVLVDFEFGMARAHGVDLETITPAGEQRDWEWHGMLGLSRSAFWRPADNIDFWLNLPWTPDGEEILAAVLRRFGPEQVCILSSPSRSPFSAAGKVAWIQRHLPRTLQRSFLIGPRKELLASPRSLLLDDNDANVARFRAAGGSAILVPRPWNSSWDAPLATVALVEQELDAWLGQP